MDKTKIILDADVIIHFSKAECLNLLPDILPEYDYLVLSTVYNEVKPPIRNLLDNIIAHWKNFSTETFAPTGDMRREYARLTCQFGKGESACMAYCRFTNNVIGSSNLRDISKYCNDNGIKHLTTMDFLSIAVERQLLTVEAANLFIKTVIQKGSKLPDITIDKHVRKVTI